MRAKLNDDQSGTERKLQRLYWVMRLGMAFLWVWTAIVSWFYYPHAESLSWLRRLGITYQTDLVFIAACVLDLAMGVASATWASRRLWQLQFAVVLFYSAAICLYLPEFLLHPFGPITKNITVLTCLAFLAIAEKR